MLCPDDIHGDSGDYNDGGGMRKIMVLLVKLLMICAAENKTTFSLISSCSFARAVTSLDRAFC